MKDHSIKHPLFVFGLAVLASSFITGCSSRPKLDGALIVHADQVSADRKMQTRVYDINDEAKILSACAALLQDTGFTLGENDIRAGLITGSKQRLRNVWKQDRDKLIKNLGKVIVSYGLWQGEKIDKFLHVTANVVTHPRHPDRMTVRVVFERAGLNHGKAINRIEIVEEPEIYQEFFSGLSKALFLEEESL